MASVPIVASSIPLAVGDALANKINKKSNVSVCFFGDACVEEGVFHESLNFASLMNLPVIFVCENNLFSVYTHINERQPKRELEELGRAHNIKSVRVDGNNVLEVAKISEILINEAKQNSQPSFLILDTYRQREHCGVNYDDNLNYRDEKEVKDWRARDPIQIAANLFNEKKIISAAKAVEIKNQIQIDIEIAFKHALKADFPKPNMAANHIFSD